MIDRYITTVPAVSSVYSPIDNSVFDLHEESEHYRLLIAQEFLNRNLKTMDIFPFFSFFVKHPF